MTTSESSDRTDQRETGREVDCAKCFASGSVTNSVLAVKVNNASKCDSNMYDRTITFTCRELVNSMCFASDSDIKSDRAVDVNNASKTRSHGLDGATRVAWGATNKLGGAWWWHSLMQVLGCVFHLVLCWSVPWFRSHL